MTHRLLQENLSWWNPARRSLYEFSSSVSFFVRGELFYPSLSISVVIHPALCGFTCSFLCSARRAMLGRGWKPRLLLLPIFSLILLATLGAAQKWQSLGGKIFKFSNLRVSALNLNLKNVRKVVEFDFLSPAGFCVVYSGA